MFALARHAVPIGCGELGTLTASENRMSASLRNGVLLKRAVPAALKRRLTVSGLRCF
jgi:hypothetical protein